MLASVPATAPAAPASDTPATTALSSQQVFVPGKLLKVHITLSAKEYEAMQPRGGFGGFGGPPKPPPPKKAEDPARTVKKNNFGTDLPWATASVTLAGETFKDIGIRYKGNGTIMDAARIMKKAMVTMMKRVGMAPSRRRKA